MQTCPICCQNKEKLISLSKCEHKFCQTCSIMHISEKADRFVQVLCADPSCKKQLDKKSQAYQLLPPKILEKLKKHEEFVYLQANSHLKPCSQKNCQGRIDMKKPKKECSQCKKAHCPKCLKLFHEGNCIMDKFDEEMKKNKYQKCPNCSIWVQKKQGCDYIDCKCGTAFCYRCGAEFASDPCRKGQILEHELEIRNTLLTFKYKLPQSPLGYVLFPIKICFQLVVFIFLTVFFSLILLFVILGQYMCAIMATPCIALHIICHETPEPCKCCALIFLPFLTVFLMVLFTFLMLMYPIFRNYYHHGIYDHLEKTILGGVKCYLGTMKGLISM